MFLDLRTVALVSGFCLGVLLLAAAVWYLVAMPRRLHRLYLKETSRDFGQRLGDVELADLLKEMDEETRKRIAKEVEIPAVTTAFLLLFALWAVVTIGLLVAAFTWR